MNVRKAKHGTLLTVLFTIISIAYVYPIFLVLINSFKKKLISAEIHSPFHRGKYLWDWIIM